MNPLSDIERKSISVIGCTGSVGRQALEVARHFGIPVAALAARRNVRAAEETARIFHPDIIAMSDESAASELRVSLADTDIKVLSGESGSEYAASYEKADTVINAASGISGLKPTLSALKSGKKLALANKESLVAAGEIVMKTSAEHSAPIIPVDSEHSAIFQCLHGDEHPDKLILTCSGGPFFGMSSDQLKDVSAEDSLSHPTWKMGAKITVDSASLMNKGFEVIEASYLFGIPGDRISVTIHRESVIHSMVQFSDGSIKAQMSSPDMRLCVMYALSYPKRLDARGFLSSIDFGKAFSLSFSPPDYSTFPLLPLAYDCLKIKGVHGAALNGADERAVELFLGGKISFIDIFRAVEKAALSAQTVSDPSLEDILEADAEARRRVDECFGL